MSTTLALEYLFDALRGAFTTWYANDPANPCGAGTVGGLCYVVEAGGVTYASSRATNPDDDSERTILGICDSVDGEVDTPVGVTQTRLVFGWRDRTQQLNQGIGQSNRVVLQPGSPDGRVGKHGPARQSGTARNPRSLGTLGETFTLYVWGADATEPTNARLQYRAARQLYDLVHAACYRYARAAGSADGSFVLSDPKWVAFPTDSERKYGAEIEVVGVIQSALPDAVGTTAPAPATVFAQSLFGEIQTGVPASV